MTYVPTLTATIGAADDASDVQELASTPVVRVLDYRCQPHSRQATSHQHDAFTVSLVQQGAFCCQSRGGTYLLEPGAMLLGQPGEEYACSHEYGGDRCLVFQFRPDALTGLVDEARPKRPATVRSVRLDVLACRIQSALDPGDLDETALLLAAEALGEAGDDTVSPAGHTSAHDRDRAHAGAEYLDRHFRHPVTLGEIAARTETSPFHFLRIFRRVLGLTPHQYLVRTRLRHAIDQLIRTDRPVTGIAYDSGFGDLSHFHHTFRRHLGCTPQALRR